MFPFLPYVIFFKYGLINNTMDKSGIVKDLRKTYNSIACDFDSTRDGCWEDCRNFVSGLDKNCRVLDLGCGNGRNLFLLEKRFSVGADFSVGFMKVIRGKDASVPLVLCDFLGRGGMGAGWGTPPVEPGG